MTDLVSMLKEASKKLELVSKKIAGMTGMMIPIPSISINAVRYTGNNFGPFSDILRYWVNRR